MKTVEFLNARWHFNLTKAIQQFAHAHIGCIHTHTRARRITVAGKTVLYFSGDTITIK